MKSIAELRRDRVRWLVKRFYEGDPKGLQKKMGYNTAGYAARLVSNSPGNWKKLGDKAARAIEKAHALDPYLLDTPLDVKTTGVRLAGLDDPLVGQLVAIFVNLSEGAQDVLLSKANRLFIEENPGPSEANPFGKLPKERAVHQGELEYANPTPARRRGK